MDRLEIFSLFLCIVVFVMFVAVFSFMLKHVIKQRVKLIKLGEEDEDIKTEYANTIKEPNAWDICAKIFSVCITVLLCIVFAFSIYVNATKDKKANGIPSLKVVYTDSMSYKNKNNKYLVTNSIDNQLQVHDLIVTRHLPDEFDLKLYDIVVYEADNGAVLIHRIVGIEEPNEKHPTSRHFKLQGDAIAYPDTYPVLYSQMRGIYVGERVPFVGSFILFMQSPAGWLCVLLVLGAVILTPILEKIIERAKKERLGIILGSDQNNANQLKDQVIDKVNAEPTPIKVYGIYTDTTSTFDGRYFYIDPTTGIKIYSSYPIQVNKADGTPELKDVVQLDSTEDKK